MRGDAMRCACAIPSNFFCLFKLSHAVSLVVLYIHIHIYINIYILYLAAILRRRTLLINRPTFFFYFLGIATLRCVACARRVMRVFVSYLFRFFFRKEGERYLFVFILIFILAFSNTLHFSGGIAPPHRTLAVTLERITSFQG